MRDPSRIPWRTIIGAGRPLCVKCSNCVGVVAGREGAWDSRSVIADHGIEDRGASSAPQERVARGAPRRGNYNVWVGTYASGQTQEATLCFTELDPEPATASVTGFGAGIPDVSAVPVYLRDARALLGLHAGSGVDGLRAW